MIPRFFSPAAVDAAVDKPAVSVVLELIHNGVPRLFYPLNENVQKPASCGQLCRALKAFSSFVFVQFRSRDANLGARLRFSSLFAYP